MKKTSKDLPVVAAFDFDGTLTYRDTLLPFLIFVCGWILSMIKFATLAPTLMSYGLGKLSRQEAKECVITTFFQGMNIDELRRHGEVFAQKRLNSLLKPEGIRRVQWHKEQGHRCVLISASIDVYLDSWAKSVGFDDLLASRLATTHDDRITGKLLGENCRGAEKTKRLDELLGPRENYILYAYGDSRGDQELLAYADRAFFRKMPILNRS